MLFKYQIIDDKKVKIKRHFVFEYGLCFKSVCVVDVIEVHEVHLCVLPWVEDSWPIIFCRLLFLHNLIEQTLLHNPITFTIFYSVKFRIAICNLLIFICFSNLLFWLISLNSWSFRDLLWEYRFLQLEFVRINSCIWLNPNDRVFAQKYLSFFQIHRKSVLPNCLWELVNLVFEMQKSSIKLSEYLSHFLSKFSFAYIAKFTLNSRLAVKHDSVDFIIELNELWFFNL